ncbi:MAG: SGNH/GDSL hydrolase family protein [Ruminococcaceae bacterium]|nr:SGNH/GDSL hydrolase family protein [Oscillospiraceae bacterium]
MKLDVKKIREIAVGAAKVFEEDGYFHFHRFTDAQMEIYEKFTRSVDYIKKTYATAGVRLEFVTDGDELRFSAHLKSSSSRKFFNFDLYVNGNMCQHIGGVYSGEDSFDYVLPFGDAGEKTVVLYFPWSSQATLKDVEVSGASYVNGLPRRPKMISIGDSITHGYDATYPSLSYASQLADKLGVEAYNKGIGGERFFPKFLETDPECDAKYITVAYGTNDWTKSSLETFENDCKEFYERLSALYPEAKIFAIAPIWRDRIETPSKCGAFCEISNYIRKVTDKLDNVYFIEGWDLTPHYPEFYSDKFLHPNDLGFCVYADRLYSAIKNIIETVE